MADVIPFPDPQERARRLEAKARHARLEAEYAGDYAGLPGHDHDRDDVDWLTLSDFEPRPNDGPYDPLLEALIELMETDADGAHSD